MSSNVVNQVSFLPTTKSFPIDSDELSFELNKAYVDIANSVNSRIIGVFPTNRPAITGESWFVNKNQKQQVLRQVYPLKSTNNIPHGIDLRRVSRFTNCYGSFTDGTNWYGAFYAGSTAIAGQITFYIDPMNIVIVPGGGAPTVSDGTIVLQWQSLV